MATTTDPNQAVTLTLTSHQSMENPPKFFAYQPTRSEKTRLVNAMRAIRQLDAAEDAWGEFQTQIEVIESVLGELLAGWKDLFNRRGKPIPFEADKLGDVLTEDQLADLAAQVLQAGQVSETEQGK